MDQLARVQNAAMREPRVSDGGILILMCVLLGVAGAIFGFICSFELLPPPGEGGDAILIIAVVGLLLGGAAGVLTGFLIGIIWILRRNSAAWRRLRSRAEQLETGSGTDEPNQAARPAPGAPLLPGLWNEK